MSIRCEIANNPNCPFHILEKLANDNRYGSENIRYVMAGNPNCPSDILKIIYNKNESAIVILKIIKHKNCSLDILKEVYKTYKNDSQKFIIEAVLNHPNWKLSDFE